MGTRNLARELQEVVVDGLSNEVGLISRLSETSMFQSFPWGVRFTRPADQYAHHDRALEVFSPSGNLVSRLIIEIESTADTNPSTATNIWNQYGRVPFGHGWNYLSIPRRKLPSNWDVFVKYNNHCDSYWAAVSCIVSSRFIDESYANQMQNYKHDNEKFWSLTVNGYNKLSSPERKLIISDAGNEYLMKFLLQLSVLQATRSTDLRSASNIITIASFL